MRKSIITASTLAAGMLLVSSTTMAAYSMKKVVQFQVINNTPQKIVITPVTKYCCLKAAFKQKKIAQGNNLMVLLKRTNSKKMATNLTFIVSDKMKKQLCSFRAVLSKGNKFMITNIVQKGSSCVVSGKTITIKK